MAHSGAVANAPSSRCAISRTSHVSCRDRQTRTRPCLQRHWRRGRLVGLGVRERLRQVAPRVHVPVAARPRIRQPHARNARRLTEAPAPWLAVIHLARAEDMAHVAGVGPRVHLHRAALAGAREHTGRAELDAGTHRRQQLEVVRVPVVLVHIRRELFHLRRRVRAAPALRTSRPVMPPSA
jgi:hypothetical protein